jgi:hypothetical protein
MARSKLALSIASLIAALIVVTVAPPPADARPRPQRGASDFRANKEFGLGIMLGDPTGLAGKYYLSADTALDFGLGYGGYYYGRGRYGFHAHMSFLWHPVVLAKPDPFWLPLYVGVGGRFLERGYFDDRYERRPRLGVRVPGGIMMDFNNVPIDIFAELALVVDFIAPRDRYRGYAGINGAIGLRYYF